MLKFTLKEIQDLVIAWLLLSIAFTILLTNPLGNGITQVIYQIFLISAVTAGLGFLLHELGHKLVAEKYNCSTRFIANIKMLFLAIALSVFGFIIAAPGGVHIKGNLTKKKMSNIAAAGPIANLLLVIAFIPGIFLLKGTMNSAAMYGFSINAWIGVFNMIPAGEFDGLKIIHGNKILYYTLLVALLIPTLLSFLVF